jgi:hypothetical protein
VDESEKYIKMCSLAKEIQQKWHFKSGDFVYDPDLDEVEVWTNYHVGDPTEYVWLPRQDQNQDMCVGFFMRIMYISEFEAHMRFLDWYSNCLRACLKIQLYPTIGIGLINLSRKVVALKP